MITQLHSITGLIDMSKHNKNLKKMIDSDDKYT